MRIPWEIYRNDPNSVAPLMVECKEAFSEKILFSNMLIGVHGSLTGVPDRSVEFLFKLINYTSNNTIQALVF